METVWVYAKRWMFWGFTWVALLQLSGINYSAHAQCGQPFSLDPLGQILEQGPSPEAVQQNWLKLVFKPFLKQLPTLEMQSGDLRFTAADGITRTDIHEAELARLAHRELRAHQLLTAEVLPTLIHELDHLESTFLNPSLDPLQRALALDAFLHLRVMGNRVGAAACRRSSAQEFYGFEAIRLILRDLDTVRLTAGAELLVPEIEGLLVDILAFADLAANPKTTNFIRQELLAPPNTPEKTELAARILVRNSWRDSRRGGVLREMLLNLDAKKQVYPKILALLDHPEGVSPIEQENLVLLFLKREGTNLADRLAEIVAQPNWTHYPHAKKILWDLIPHLTPRGILKILSTREWAIQLDAMAWLEIAVRRTSQGGVQAAQWRSQADELLAQDFWKHNLELGLHLQGQVPTFNRLERYFSIFTFGPEPTKSRANEIH